MGVTDIFALNPADELHPPLPYLGLEYPPGGTKL